MLMVRALCLSLAVSLAGCKCGGTSEGPRAAQLPPDAAAPPRSAPEGIVVERIPIHLPPAVAVPNPTLTLVRIDPRKYAPRLFTAAEHDGPRTVTAWAKQFGLIAVVNASMYDQSGKSVSFMVDGERINNARDDARFGGLLAFGEDRDASVAPIAMVGRSCSQVDVAALRKGYRTVIANYRLLDCAGAPISWKDEKAYSAAAIGMDRDGWVVLAHSRAPYRMEAFARVLGAPELRIVSAVYVEGGPEASLLVEADGLSVREVGSYESHFREDDGNTAFWDIPNVIGFAPRTL